MSENLPVRGKILSSDPCTVKDASLLLHEFLRSEAVPDTGLLKGYLLGVSGALDELVARRAAGKEERSPKKRKPVDLSNAETDEQAPLNVKVVTPVANIDSGAAKPSGEKEERSHKKKRRHDSNSAHAEEPTLANAEAGRSSAVDALSRVTQELVSTGNAEKEERSHKKRRWPDSDSAHDKEQAEAGRSLEVNALSGVTPEPVSGVDVEKKERSHKKRRRPDGNSAHAEQPTLANAEAGRSSNSYAFSGVTPEPVSGGNVEKGERSHKKRKRPDSSSAHAEPAVEVNVRSGVAQEPVSGENAEQEERSHKKRRRPDSTSAHAEQHTVANAKAGRSLEVNANSGVTSEPVSSGNAEKEKGSHKKRRRPDSNVAHAEQPTLAIAEAERGVEGNAEKEGGSRKRHRLSESNEDILLNAEAGSLAGQPQVNGSKKRSHSKSHQTGVEVLEEQGSRSKKSKRQKH